MQKKQSFSMYALIIAVLIHLLVFLLLLFIEKISPTPPKESQKSESRFKLSLKPKPDAPKEALVKNTIQKETKARPLPKGEQLTKPTPPPKQTPPQPKSTQKPVEAPQPQQPTPPVAQPTQPQPKKAFENHVAKKVATIEKTSPSQGLYDTLSQPDSTASNSQDSIQTGNESIKKLYGDKFAELSEGEQKYIINNQEQMRRITQGVLNRYGRSRIPDNLRANDTNTIEFYLYPDGHISDIHFIDRSSFNLLDDTTKETIEIAYAKYPRPEQKTYIRYRVFYNLQ
jgi:outer membrane biosynthesis protein TonB